MAQYNANEADHVTLCEVLDRVLNAGVALSGDLVISVADVDLIYVGLRVLLSSVETARLAGVMPASMLAKQPQYAQAG